MIYGCIGLEGMMKRIDTNLFDFDTPLCQAFKEFNYLFQINVGVLTNDIPRVKTYEEYKNDWIYEWNNGIPWVDENPWTNDGMEVGYCNTGDLPGFIREGNLIRYEDYEWYNTIEESELKEEALINKRTLEESMNMIEELSDDEWDHDLPVKEWKDYEHTTYIRIDVYSNQNTYNNVCEIL
uniref:Uncharacterized protein n=1 Tax=Tanacetum cinerariifolium TaxID=118510 RepID=A0A6L2MGR5_TANCI|nr:hypothetical protein [Tanacetum cinerariifolium]